MPTDVAKPKVTPNQILEDMARLTSRQLATVLEQATLLRLQKDNRLLKARESDLLRIINRGLSAQKAARLGQLEERLRQETISRQEHAQLLRLTEELERLAAERLKALTKLAALRKTSVADLIREMGLAEPAYA